MLTLLALILATLGLGTSAALAARLRALARRLETVERRAPGPSALRAEGKPLSEPRPLHGLRVAVAVAQDHPHPIFANLLKEALAEEEALLVEREADFAIQARLVGNGYADVYYEAEVSALGGKTPLFAFTERPPHGDRPENLAREVVARLREEARKRERRAALRELHGG